MSSHISYHPIGTDIIRRYVAYLSASDAASHAAYDYDGSGAHERFRQPFVMMAEAARKLTGNFDETHGLNLAATQGFFGTYYYVHNARLSAFADVLDPYTSAWHELIPGWQAAETARNQLGDVASSGVFISAHKVGQLMNDVHTVTELQVALAREFPADKLQILWAALSDAHASGMGLLEASGVIELNASDIRQSTCLSNQTNCDPAGLRLYMANAPKEPVAPAPAPAAAPVAPPPTQSPVVATPPPQVESPILGEHEPLPVRPVAEPGLAHALQPMQSTPGLSERLRKRSDGS